MKWTHLWIVVPAVATAASAAAQPQPKPCSAPDYRQLDFWVGEWALEYDRPDGTVGTATNTITKDEYGSCVIVEKFAMPNGYKGTSYSVYDREKKHWRQMWVDNQGGTFTLVGGPAQDKGHVFELRTLEPTGREQLMRRMIWEDVSPGQLTWRWQALQSDGRWKDDWVLRYVRREQTDR
jgi:hypothetical protein